MSRIVDAATRVQAVSDRPEPGAGTLVREGNELIAIVTTIIKNKRRNVIAKRGAEKEARIPNS